jgi:CHAD domain-containing protein
VSYRFEPDESVPEAFVRAAAEQLADAEHDLRTGIQDDPVSAVHSARKSLKKERSLLRLTRAAVSGTKRRRENVALRDAGRALSATRDAEVLVQTLDELSERYAGQVPEAVFGAFRERLEAGRQVAREQLTDPAVAVEVAGQLAAVRRRISKWKLGNGDWPALAGGLKRTYADGRRAFDKARSRPDTDSLHEWRKRSKDLWYELRLVGPICGQAVRGQAKEAHALADLLGDDHDLAVLRQTLTQTGAQVASDLDAVLGLLDHRRQQLQAEAMFVGERVYAESPKAFVKRIHRSWKAGRGLAEADAVHDDATDLAQATRAVSA